MPASPFTIKSFEIKTGTDQEYALLSEFANQLRAERQPDDPPVPLEERTQSWRNIPPFVDVIAWAILNTEQSVMLGSSYLQIIRTEDNPHVCEGDVSVLPEYRRQGMGRYLLAAAVEAAQRENRRLLIGSTSDRIPAGEIFMQRLGAQRGLEAATNQLRIADLNRELISKWQAQAVERAPGFTLGLWDGPYPEEQIETIAKLWDLTNQQPRGDLELHDAHFTPEQLRQMEQQQMAGGTQRWTMYVTEPTQGKFAGYTEVFWNANRPEILGQGMTAVYPEYRNLGLGRLLKAAMLEKVLQERPQVKFIRTGNADSNAPMLKINTELGFERYMSQVIWQVETQKVLEYLQQKST
jgi:mycothiol synthase